MTVAGATVGIGIVFEAARIGAVLETERSGAVSETVRIGAVSEIVRIGVVSRIARVLTVSGSDARVFVSLARGARVTAVFVSAARSRAMSAGSGARTRVTAVFGFGVARIGAVFVVRESGAVVRIGAVF